MTQSAAFCRTQEAFHRDRAAGTTLENVRTVAVRAAAAWNREASLADQLENKRRAGGTLPAAGSLTEEQDDQLFSENPDRGQASA